jgi:hypothetical protein
MGQIDRERVAGGKTRDAADVILVLMGHDNRIEVLRNAPATAQPMDGFIDTETAIEQYASSAGFDDETVALAAAAK